jgi:hypothetical protein
LTKDETQPNTAAIPAATIMQEQAEEVAWNNRKTQWRTGISFEEGMPARAPQQQLYLQQAFRQS